MNDIELRLQCVRIASENLKASGGPVTEEEVRKDAEKLFQYIWNGQIKMAA